MHGGPDGSLLSEYNGVSGKQLLNEDLKVWGDSLNIKIYDVSKLSSEELKSVIKSSDREAVAVFVQKLAIRLQILVRGYAEPAQFVQSWQYFLLK